MKTSRKITSVASLVLAVGLSTTLLGGTAHAAKPTPKIAGQHLVIVQGFNGETPSTAVYHLTIKKNNGNAFIGTQRWRECTDNIEKCET